MNNFYSPGILPNYAMPSFPTPLVSNDISINSLPTQNQSNQMNSQMNYQNQPPQSQQINMGLRQLKDFEMINTFQDSDGRTWKLAKSANDSSVEIPDPQYVQVTDYWSHEFPNSNGKVFIYVVEGIKRPRVDNEKPVSVLYQWFSTSNNPNWNPGMINQSEWHRANVFTSPMTSSRVSKLKALCKYTEVEQLPQKPESIPDIDLSKKKVDYGCH